MAKIIISTKEGVDPLVFDESMQWTIIRWEGQSTENLIDLGYGFALGKTAELEALGVSCDTYGHPCINDECRDVMFAFLPPIWVSLKPDCPLLADASNVVRYGDSIQGELGLEEPDQSDVIRRLHAVLHAEGVVNAQANVMAIHRTRR